MLYYFYFTNYVQFVTLNSFADSGFYNLIQPVPVSQHVIEASARSLKKIKRGYEQYNNKQYKSEQHLRHYLNIAYIS